jgi:hypothetical protein
MTHTIPRASAIALGLAAFVSLSPLAARADSSTPPAPNPSAASSAAQPSLAEPAPTPGWAEAGPNGPTAAQRSAMRYYPRHRYARHYAWRNGRRYDRYYSRNPVARAATGVAGGIADLGSIAAYPFYCFPDYGSCSVRVPYRY